MSSPTFLAVEVGVNHHDGADDKAGDDTCDKQVTDGLSGGQTVHNERYGRRDYYAETACRGDHADDELLAVAEVNENRDTHGADSRDGRGSGAGNRAVKQAGDDGRIRHTAGGLAYKVGEKSVKSVGYAALSHQVTGEDEERNSQ